MHRNTFIFVIFLAILSAFIAGVNISNRMYGEKVSETPIISVSPTPTLGETKSIPQILTYDNEYCGISLTFDTAALRLSEEASDSAIFVNAEDPKDEIALGCSMEIPRPALTKENIEERVVASVSATLYHDSSAKDGTKMDAVIFTHPKNGLDIFIAGYGKTYEGILGTVTVK